MTDEKLQINMIDFVLPIARMVDLMNPSLGEHHMRVAYLAYRIGEELELPGENICNLVIAGCLHDIGAFSLRERLDLMEFEEEHPEHHCWAGYRLLSKYKPFERAAEIVKNHHASWNNGTAVGLDQEDIVVESHILHLADRAAVRISNDQQVLSQVRNISHAIEQGRGSRFAPLVVDAFLTLAQRDYIWFEVSSPRVDQIIGRSMRNTYVNLDLSGLLDFSMLLSTLIDFKSRFTATHSSGVSATGVALAGLMGYSESDQMKMEIAGYLHDLGKLAVPSEIIEKPGKLDEDEWFVMRSHVYYTYMILEQIDSLELINSWGGLHQEKLNGAGYPFGLSSESIPQGARILAVADVFTALTEDRPYRSGMDMGEASKVLQDMADNKHLDAELVDRALNNFAMINAVREEAQQEAARRYEEFYSWLNPPNQQAF